MNEDIMLLLRQICGKPKPPAATDGWMGLSEREPSAFVESKSGGVRCRLILSYTLAFIMCRYPKRK